MTGLLYSGLLTVCIHRYFLVLPLFKNKFGLICPLNAEKFLIKMRGCIKGLPNKCLTLVALCATIKNTAIRVLDLDLGL